MMQQRQPFPGGEFCSQPQPPFNNDNHDLRSSFENSHPNAHPHKRPRNSQTINTNLPNLATLPPPVLKSNHSTIPVNRGTTHIFYKTRMCQKFLEGNCRNGDKCTFAHGSKDLREPPPNWQELVKENRGGSGGETWIDDQRIIQKMKICRKFYNGEECPYGGKCNFLHESPAKFKADSTMDMGRTRGNSRESSVINVQTMGPHMDQRIGGGQIDVVQPMDNIPDAIRLSTMSSDTDVVRPSMKAVYWKTRICSKWEATGQCPYGDRCHYAHGLAELHIPIGCIEADGHPYAAGSIMAKGLNVTVPEVLPADAAISTPGGQQGEGRGWARLAHKKLNRIYADWIDDQEDEQVTPNKVD